MADFVKLTSEVLSVEDIFSSVAISSTGATSLFVGTTRDHFDGRTVVRLEYEAYESMALKTLKRLCSSIRFKWSDVTNVAIHHRLGPVGPMEASVVIAVSSPHRKDSLEAVAFAIDELKATVPIWKKEWYEDGSEWKENEECAWSGKSCDQEAPTVDPSLIQINASDDEVERRIQSFISRKRCDINAANVLEFCSRHVTDEQDDFSCARTDSVLVRKKDSFSHLRQSNVENAWGPSGPGAVEKAKGSLPTTEGFEERFRNLEDHVDLEKPVPADVYERLKGIEDRVLYLEGLSPEYFALGGRDRTDIFGASNGAGDVEETLQQREYKETLSKSLTTINRRIQELQSKLLARS